VHAAKGPIPPAPQITTTPAKAMPGAKGSTTVYSRPKSVAGGFASVGSGIAQAPGRRLSESRVREHLMHGLMRQGVETRAGNNPPQAPLPDLTSRRRAWGGSDGLRGIGCPPRLSGNVMRACTCVL
jgi:hypothetical protein